MKTILVMTSLFPNSKEPNRGIFVHKSLKFLKKYFDITVIAPIPYFPFVRQNRPRDIPYQETIEGLEVFHPRFVSIPKVFKVLDPLFFYLATIRLARKIDKDKKFDLIDSHLIYPDGVGSWFVANKLKKTFSITLRGVILYHTKRSDTFSSKYYAKPRTNFLIRYQIRKALDSSDNIFAMSETLKAGARELTNNNIVVIPNGVELDIFEKIDRSEARSMLKLSHHDKIVLAIGSDYRLKGFFDLVNAFQGIQAHLVIIGKDQPRNQKKLKELIDETDQEDKITLIDHVDNTELYKWYSAADLLCLPSYHEGSPNVVMEALACGLPVIVTKEAAGEFINPNIGIQTTIENLGKDIKRGLSSKWDPQPFKKFRLENTRDQRAKETSVIFNRLIEEKTKVEKKVT